MKLLDRHVLREIVGPFLFGVAAFSSIMFAGRYLLELTTYVLNQGMPISIAAQILLLSIPSVVVLTLPMSALLAVLLGFGRLSGDCEVTALFAGGVSIYRCAVPVAILGLAVSITAFLLNEVVVPEAGMKAKELTAQALKQIQAPKSFSYVEEKDGVTNQIYVQGGIDVKNRVMRNVFVTQIRNKKPALFFRADEAVYQGGDEWALRNGYFKSLAPSDGGIRTESGTFNDLKTVVINVGRTPRQMALAAMKPEEMSIRQLSEQIRVMRNVRADTKKLEVGFWQKFALPLACLVFALLGAPLGIRPQRTSSSMGLGLSIFIILLFWLLWHYTTAVAAQGGIPTVVGAFFPDVVGISVACLLMGKAAK